MTDNSLPAELLIDTIEQVDQLHEKILQYEQNCLNSVLIRYSLAKKVIIDPNKVVRYDDTLNPNKWEWIYDNKYLLYTRELMSWVENGTPKFKIIIDYNPELTWGNEL